MRIVLYWVVPFMWILFLTSLYCLVMGIYKKSGKLMLISALTLLPHALYFYGGNNWMRSAILVPIVEVVIAIVFWFRQKR